MARMMTVPPPSSATAVLGCAGRSIVSKPAGHLLLISVLLIGGCEKPKSGSGQPGSPSAPLEMDRSRKAQAERLRLIDKLQREGVIAQVDRPGMVPHVWVTSQFIALDSASKRRYMKTVFCYFAAPEPYFGTQEGDILVIRDSGSGRRIGHYSARTGLTLE